MADLVNQPDNWPTRKLMVAAAVGPAAVEAWPGLVALVTPDLVPVLAGPGVSGLVGAFAALAVGYFVRDRANV